MMEETNYFRTFCAVFVTVAGKTDLHVLGAVEREKGGARLSQSCRVVFLGRSGPGFVPATHKRETCRCRRLRDVPF